MNITLASTGPQLFPAKRRYQKTAVRRSVCWLSRAPAYVLVEFSDQIKTFKF